MNSWFKFHYVKTLKLWNFGVKETEKVKIKKWKYEKAFYVLFKKERQMKEKMIAQVYSNSFSTRPYSE